MLFEPLDFISKLAALVPAPRVNLTRFYGVFAPLSQYRAIIAPSRPAVENKTLDDAVQTEAEKKGAMPWAVRLKRAVNIDVSTCERCGGSVRVIACIEDPVVIKKILGGMQSKQGNRQQKSIITLPVRAPPAERLSY